MKKQSDKEAVENLVAMVETIINNAPKEKPELYNGDNHSDSWANGYDICHHGIAAMLTSVLRPFTQESRDEKAE